MNFVEGALDRDGLFVSEGGAVRIELPSGSGARHVTLGVRPEDVYVDGDRQRERSLSRPISAVLEVVEPMGYETVLYARAGELRLVARVEPQPLPDPGGELGLRFDTARVRLFDAETGAALRVDPAPAPEPAA